jgi:hypothetical protein
MFGALLSASEPVFWRERDVNMDSERHGEAAIGLEMREQPEVTGSTTADVAAELDQAIVDEGLASKAANRDRTYYEAAADADAAAQYYSAVGATATGPELLRALQTLLTRTHTQTPRYAPARIPHGVPMGGPASRPPAPVHVLRQIL